MVQKQAAESPATDLRRNAMKQKIALISLALIGFVFVFSGNAWANRDHRGGHYVANPHPHIGQYHQNGHGWYHGRGFHPNRFHRGPQHRGWSYRPARRTVEKHVYHHYNSDDRYTDGDQYQAAGTLSDPGFSFSFGISGTR
jgi:hypothetical protein